MPDEVTVEAGFITLPRSSGPPVRYPLAGLLRVADIPTGLTYTQISSIKALANLIVILIRTLIDKGVLDENFGESDGDLDMDLEHIIHAIEQMGGAYDDPDLTGAGE